MEITLTGDIEKALLAEAKEHGTSPEQLALDSLRREFAYTLQGNNSSDGLSAQGSDGAPGTLAEYLADYVGIVHSREHVQVARHR